MESAAFGTAIVHPGPAPEVAAAARPATLSMRARLTLGWRACHGPIALAISVVPAALAFAPERPWSARLLLLAAAAVVFVVVRGALRRTWASRPSRSASAIAAGAGSRRWPGGKPRPARTGSTANAPRSRSLATGGSRPSQRNAGSIEAGMRHAIDDLHEIDYRIELARTSRRPEFEEAQAAVLRAELDLRTVGGRR